MTAITDADGNVAQVTPEGLLQVAINGTVASSEVFVKRNSDGLRINPARDETLTSIIDLLTTIRDQTDTLESTIFRRTDSLAAGTNRIGLTVFDRPSLGPNRTHKSIIQLANTGVDVVIYTPPVGKTLYISSMVFSAFNTSVAAIGDIRIQDGDSVEVPLIIPVAGTSAQQMDIGSLTFLEPKQFSTNIRVVVASGTVTWAATFTGYEE